jgi:hypothetical protein
MVCLLTPGISPFPVSRNPQGKGSINMVADDGCDFARPPCGGSLGHPGKQKYQVFSDASTVHESANSDLALIEE